jgi:hypothetical protein
MTEIYILKSRARFAYLRFQSVGAGTRYDHMGNSLLKYVSSEACQAARDYNEAMRQLKEIDPDCPNYTPL